MNELDIKIQWLYDIAKRHDNQIIDAVVDELLLNIWTVDAIIFLAPISCFDLVLSEDRTVNRLVRIRSHYLSCLGCFLWNPSRLVVGNTDFFVFLFLSHFTHHHHHHNNNNNTKQEDSVLLWKMICSNKLLAHVELVLFLNKCDILARKLERGVRLARYVRSFQDRANDAETVQKCECGRGSSFDCWLFWWALPFELFDLCQWLFWSLVSFFLFVFSFTFVAFVQVTLSWLDCPLNVNFLRLPGQVRCHTTRVFAKPAQVLRVLYIRYCTSLSSLSIFFFPVNWFFSFSLVHYLTFLCAFACSLLLWLWLWTLNVSSSFFSIFIWAGNHDDVRYSRKRARYGRSRAPQAEQASLRNPKVSELSPSPFLFWHAQPPYLLIKFSHSVQHFLPTHIYHVLHAQPRNTYVPYCTSVFVTSLFFLVARLENLTVGQFAMRERKNSFVILLPIKHCCYIEIYLGNTDGRGDGIKRKIRNAEKCNHMHDYGEVESL